MNFWSAFPFLRLALMSILGILSVHIFLLTPDQLLILILTGISFLIFLLRFGRLFPVRYLASIRGFILLFLIFIGFNGHVQSTDPQADVRHWVHQNAIDAYEAILEAKPKKSGSFHSYTLRMSCVYRHGKVVPTIGRFQLLLKRPLDIEYGDRILVIGHPVRYAEDKNPFGFDFSAYNERKGLYGVHFSETSKIRVFRIETFNLFRAAHRISARLEGVIERYLSDEGSRGVAKALLLGNRTELGSDIKANFSRAGLMHILAVSGLHVGILYLLVRLFFGRLLERRGWRLPITILCVGLIWFYALVTGLSDSVVRASVMFSVMSGGQALGRRNIIYNSIGIAAFVMILHNPRVIYEVGFQLSFLAVLGIVFLYPRIYPLLSTGRRLPDKLWALTVVSISAQIATAPLTIYYFNQFPSYFLIGNLLGIPAASLIMFSGILMFLTDIFFATLASGLGWLLNQFLWTFNGCIEWFAHLPGAVIDNLLLESWQVVLIYLILITFLMGRYRYSIHSLQFSLVALLILVIASIIDQFSVPRREYLLMYSFPGKTAMEYVIDQESYIFFSDSLSFDQKDRMNNHHLENGISDVKAMFWSDHDSGLKISTVGSYRIVMLDGFLASGYQIIEPIECDLLIVNNQGVKNLGWLRSNFQYDQIIIGSDNSRRYSYWLSDKLDSLGIKNHSLLIDGFWLKSI